MSIPTMFRLVRVLTSEMLGRRLPVFMLLLWQRQHIIVTDAQLNYFICIKDFNAQTITSLELNLFYFFIYCCQHHERKKTCLDIFLLSDRTVRYRTPVFTQLFSCWVTLKQHFSIGVFVVYIDTGSPVPNIPSKLRGLADKNKKFLTEWKWFKTTVLSI
jgi:hypothetical protein